MMVRVLFSANLPGKTVTRHFWSEYDMAELTPVCHITLMRSLRKAVSEPDFVSKFKGIHPGERVDVAAIVFPRF